MITKHGDFAIRCFDTYFTSLAHFAGVYTITAPSGESAIIDTGSPSHYLSLKEQLAKINITPKTLSYIFITHMHMDHSGGAYLFSQDFPNARFIVHPDAIPNLVDPSILIHQTKHFMPFHYEAEFGSNIINGIDPNMKDDKIIAAKDGMEIDFAGAGPLKILHTAGHERTHISIFEPKSRTMFCGDSFGVRYSHIDPKAVFASTSPPDFNPADMLKSIKKMLKEEPAKIALAHYGMFNDVENHTKKCEAWIKKMNEISVKGKNVKQAVLEEFKKLYGDKLVDFWENLKTDVTSNSCGVEIHSKHLYPKIK